jgi:glycosyltransferase involved in cell wall biosynthesis
MKALYKLAAVVCDISYAGSGTTTLEAFCFGKPVIGMRTPKSFITHGKNGFLIQRGDHEAFGEYIIRILDDQRLSRALSVNARRAFEEKFYINSRLMKLASLFRHLMRDKIN